MPGVAQRIQSNFENTNFKPKSADIVNFFKPKKDDLQKAVVSRSMLQKPTWLPVIKTENLELEEFLDEGIIKLKYRDKEEFELFFNPHFGAPGKFEEKLFYILLAATQLQKRKNIKEYRTLHFSSLYSILRLMGYDRVNASKPELSKKLEDAIKRLTTTGVFHKKYYSGIDERGNKVYKTVLVSSMIQAMEIDNVDSGRSHTISIELNNNYFKTTIDPNVTDIELKEYLDIRSGPALKLYEHLNSYDKTFYNRGWWTIYLDNFVSSLGIKNNFEYDSEKLRFIETAFDNCKPALKLSLELKIKDSLHFTYWQNKGLRKRKSQDTTICFYTSRWEPVILYQKANLDSGYISDIELPSVLPDAY